MTHIVLLGDSIFDNKAYVGGGADVVTHLRAMIPDEWRATLNAVDGNVVEDVARQLQKIPADATHLFISAGGNNALRNADILSLRANSAAEVFDALADRVGDFEYHYREMLKIALSRDLPIAVCTIYDPNFSDALMQKIATAALRAFNDAIIRQAVAHGLPFLDLRLICSERADYANEIEPSVEGGRKIAARIVDLLEKHDFSRRRTEAYA